MNKNEFFTKASLCISSSLDIEKGLFCLLEYLKEIMPVTQMYLETWDESVKSTRTVAVIKEDGGRKVDLLTPLSGESEKWASGFLTPKEQKVFLFEDPWGWCLAKDMMTFHDIDLSSLILLPLETGGQITGSLILGAEGTDQFTQEHSDIILILSEILALAMSNCLRYRDELQHLEQSFFWEVTKRICGTLELEKGLQSCLNYLKKHIPADALYLEQYEEKSRSVVFIARAYPDKSEMMNMTIPLTEEEAEGTEKLGQAWGKKEIPQDFAFIANDPDQERITHTLLKASEEPTSSILSLPLFSGNRVTGALVVLAYGKGRFDENHAKLISTIREPVFLALTNSLRHRDEVKLYERNFFWEATQRICGNLNIEEGLFELHKYIRSYMPVAEMFLQHYEPSEKSMRTIARVRETEYEKTELLTPLSEEAIYKIEHAPTDLEAFFLDNPASFPVSRDMSSGHKIKPTAAIILTLNLDQDLHGYLAITSESPNVLTQEHMKWINLLKGPLSIAMSNTLRYRDEVKLYERNFFWEATQRVCSTFEIEKGLKNCFDLIEQYMPADALYLEKYHEDEMALHFLASAKKDSCAYMDTMLRIPGITREIMAEIEAQAEKHTVGDVIVFNRVDDMPHQDEVLDALGLPPSSAMSLPLMIGEECVGILDLFAHGEDRFTEEHVRIFSILREPMALAMSNALKHRNELRLFNRDFFFEVTRRICGNLEIENGLHECFQYISGQLPGYKMYLERFDRGFESMYLVAQADQEKGEKLDQMVPLDNEAIQSIEKFADLRRKGELPRVIILNKPNEEPIIRCMMQARNEPASSVLLLPLVIGDQHLGTVALLAEGKDRFTEEHADLFAILREPFFVAMSNTLKHREVLQLKDMLADDNRFLHQELHRISGDEIIGAGYGLKDTMHKIEQVASLESPVLLLGETGVGKDVVANYIHYSSARSKGPFVSVNCGAIPESLLDSELFGHEKGAFTGALSQKRGRFERANTGTIFLDEVGELPQQAQVRLLRVLQQKEFERVGGTKTISLDIRIIAATNRNLEEMVKAGDFREDLWFRLNVFPVEIPPLRNRTIDIPALLQHFITEKSKEMKLHNIPEIVPGAMDDLMKYPWPGNVRELQNVVERALILDPAGPLTFEHIKPAGPASVPVVSGNISEEIVTLDEMTAAHIRKALQKTEGKIHGKGGAAEILGINANTLRNRMNKLGIDYKKK